VTAAADVASLDTREPKRDAHLKSADFFDVAQFPTITFKSKRIQKGKEGLQLTGDLTIHGVTKEVTFDVKGPSQPGKDPFMGTLRSGAVATTKLNRKDFKMVWNKALETGGVLVGDEVNLRLDIELVRPSTPAAK
jgi:polyisoprenoid-binding protein YceI